MKPAARIRIFERVKDAPAADADASKPKVYKFRANDGEYDRYQDRLSVAGWKLDAFNANPVILFNHDAGDGGFLGLKLGPPQLPIGRGRAFVEGKALMVEIQFDQADEFAKQIESKVEQGILNAVSVRYLIPDGKYVENEKGGLDSSEQELLEISVVTIPGNQRAVRVKDLSDGEQRFLDEIAERVAVKVAAKIAPVAAPEVSKQFNPDEVAVLAAGVLKHLKEQR